MCLQQIRLEKAGFRFESLPLFQFRVGMAPTSCSRSAISRLVRMGISVAIVERVDCIAKPKTRLRTTRIPVLLAGLTTADHCRFLNRRFSHQHCNFR